ncbi:MAG: energy transducer TonB [Vicinamibacterales bacterium]
MARGLFDDVAHPSVRVGSRAWYVLPLSILAHAAIGAAVIVVPLVATDILPRPGSVMPLLVSTPPDPPPIPAAPRSAAAHRTAAPVAVTDAAPRDAPSTIAPAAAGSAVVSTPGPLIAGGVGDGMGIVANVSTAPPLPPPAARVELYRTGGHIRNPEKTRHVSPIYPPIAVANRVEGAVRIEAVIGTDGRVQNASIVKSIPLLDQAALAAVRQWRFTPTTLNGVAVPVIMTVTVNFTLR